MPPEGKCKVAPPKECGEWIPTKIQEFPLPKPEEDDRFRTNGDTESGPRKPDGGDQKRQVEFPLPGPTDFFAPGTSSQRELASPVSLVGKLGPFQPDYGQLHVAGQRVGALRPPGAALTAGAENRSIDADGGLHTTEAVVPLWDARHCLGGRQPEAVHHSGVGFISPGSRGSGMSAGAGDWDLSLDAPTVDDKPKWGRCGYFRWKARWEVAKAAMEGRTHAFVIQHVTGYARWKDKCESFKELNFNFLEAWFIGANGLAPATYSYRFGKPLDRLGAKDIRQMPDDLFEMGKDRDGKNPFDPSCGMWELNSTVFLAAELPMHFERTTDEDEINKLKSDPVSAVQAGTLPYRKGGLADWEREKYLIYPDPVMQRCASCAWDCCYKPYPAGKASWIALPERKFGGTPGQSWWYDDKTGKTHEEEVDIELESGSGAGK